VRLNIYIYVCVCVRASVWCIYVKRWGETPEREREREREMDGFGWERLREERVT